MGKVKINITFNNMIRFYAYKDGNEEMIEKVEEWIEVNDLKSEGGPEEWDNTYAEHKYFSSEEDYDTLKERMLKEIPELNPTQVWVEYPGDDAPYEGLQSQPMDRYGNPDGSADIDDSDVTESLNIKI